MRKLLALSIMAVALSGCGNTTVSTPAAPQSVELKLARGIDDARASIIEAKNLYAAHPSPAFKDALNKIIATEQEIETTFSIYHAAIKAGGTPDAATLQSDLARLVADSALLVAYWKGE